MALSEEQKKDLKFKLYAGASLLVILIPILVLGPFLPKFISKWEKTPTQPESAKRMLLAIQIQANSMRGPAARKNLETRLKLFADESVFDFTDVMNGTAEYTMPKYEMRDGLLEEGLTPWLFPEGRPPAAKAADLTLVGKALEIYAGLLEGEREYAKAAHIFICLANLWPQDSPGQLAGEEGYKRTIIRSF